VRENVNSMTIMSKRTQTGSLLVIDLTNIDTMPIINIPAQPAHSIATMADVNAAVAAAGIQPPNLPAGIAGMPQQLQQMQQQLQGQLQLLADDIARVNNRASALGDHPLMPLRIGANPVPNSFPVDLNSLRSMSSASLTQCLQYYGLAVGGSIKNKKLRLAGHIGALRV
jgi:hypothetical protein